MQKINFSNQFSSFLIFTPLFDSLILIDKKKTEGKTKKKTVKNSLEKSKGKRKCFRCYAHFLE